MSLLVQSYSFTFRLAKGLDIISSTVGLDRNTKNTMGFVFLSTLNIPTIFHCKPYFCLRSPLAFLISHQSILPLGVHEHYTELFVHVDFSLHGLSFQNSHQFIYICTLSITNHTGVCTA
jgi:hypothetical protein